MEAETVLTDLERQGLKLSAEGEKLLVRPSEAITPEVRSTIQTFKKDLLRLVTPKRTTPAFSADQIKTLRNLHRPGGLEANRFLLAIRPKPGTYLGLPINPVSTPKALKLFASALAFTLRNTKTLKHHSRTHRERKELTLLAAVLLPPEWTLETSRRTLTVRPPHEAAAARQNELQRWRSCFASKQIHAAKRRAMAHNHHKGRYE